MIRAAFFDIDNTLVPYGEPRMPEGTAAALARLHKRGVAVVLATGRRENYIGHATGSLPFSPDALVLANGQICKVGGRTVRKAFLDEKDARAGIEYLLEQGIYSIVGEEVDNWSLQRKEDCRYVRQSAGQYPLYPLDRLDTHGLISLMPSVFECDANLEAELLARMPHSQSERWNPEAIDIIASEGGKGIGIRVIAEALGLSRNEIVAFGDAQNDISMFEAAGTSVALGNAAPACKEAATFVTAPCDENGVALALEALGLI